MILPEFAERGRSVARPVPPVVEAPAAGATLTMQAGPDRPDGHAGVEGQVGETPVLHDTAPDQGPGLDPGVPRVRCRQGPELVPAWGPPRGVRYVIGHSGTSRPPGVGPAGRETSAPPPGPPVHPSPPASSSRRLDGHPRSGQAATVGGGTAQAPTPGSGKGHRSLRTMRDARVSCHRSYKICGANRGSSEPLLASQLTASRAVPGGSTERDDGRTNSAALMPGRA